MDKSEQVYVIKGLDLNLGSSTEVGLMWMVRLVNMFLLVS